jgi:hypothetical protein
VQPDAKVIERTPTVVVATWKNVAMLLLHEAPEPDQVHRLGELVADLRRDTELPVGLLHVVRTEAVKPPSDATRRVYRDLMRDPYSPLAASAVVVESAVAFASALVSSVITGLELVTRPAFPTRMFSKVDAAVPWLAAKLDARKASFGAPESLLETVARTFGDQV